MAGGSATCPHAPPTCRRVRDSCRRKTRAWRRVVARLPEFLPLVGRSVANESNGGDILPARVIIGEVAEKVYDSDEV